MLASIFGSRFSSTLARVRRPGLLHAFALVFGSFILLLTSPVTQADVWGFVDANGIGHYANHQVDKRYVLFFKEKTTRQDARAMQRTVLPAGWPVSDRSKVWSEVRPSVALMPVSAKLLKLSVPAAGLAVFTSTLRALLMASLPAASETMARNW